MCIRDSHRTVRPDRGRHAVTGEDERVLDQHVEHAPLGTPGPALHRRTACRQDRPARQGFRGETRPEIDLYCGVASRRLKTSRSASRSFPSSLSWRQRKALAGHSEITTLVPARATPGHWTNQRALREFVRTFGSLPARPRARQVVLPSPRPKGGGMCSVHGLAPAFAGAVSSPVHLLFFVFRRFLFCLSRWASVFSYFACGASAVAGCLARLFDLKESQTDAQRIRTTPAFSSHLAKRRKANGRKTGPCSHPHITRQNPSPPYGSLCPQRHVCKAVSYTHLTLPTSDLV